MKALVGILAFGSLALAQGDIPSDISAWFRDTAALAAVVAAMVALIRKHIWKGLDGLYVVLVSVVLGVGLAYLGHRMGYLGTDWVAFGLMAGLGASGGTAWLRSVVGGGSGASPAGGDTRTDAERARLR